MKKILFVIFSVLAFVPTLGLFTIRMDIHNFMFLIGIGLYTILFFLGFILFSVLYFKSKTDLFKNRFKKLLVLSLLIAHTLPLSIINSKLNLHFASKYLERISNEVVLLDVNEVSEHLKTLGWENWNNYENAYTYDYRFTTIKYPLRIKIDKSENKFSSYVYINIDDGFFIVGDFIKKKIHINGRRT